MIYKEELERIRRELSERRDDLLVEMDKLPDGELLCTGKENKRKYYQRLPAKGYRKKEHRYGIKKKPDTLNGLVRKEYITNAVSVIEKDIKALDSLLRRYQPFDENSVMQLFLEKYPELSAGIYADRADHEKWKNALHSIDGFHPESLRAIDLHGRKRRSNPEIYIASRLDHYGLTYRHDCPTGIPGLYRIPDFQILRPRDLRVIFWEHFGMMDDIEYRIDYKQKLSEYEAHGIVPWDNLITTFNTANGGIDAQKIEAAIRGWLV